MVDRAERLGGECAVPAWKIPGLGKMAVVRDLDGNRIGRWERRAAGRLKPHVVGQFRPGTLPAADDLGSALASGSTSRIAWPATRVMATSVSTVPLKNGGFPMSQIS
ncbi:VOC family protein [Saccharopolyspora pogona]|uniref:hypothetical protein n=1 Tax=Saccharopolyspora pogona TaxID=333966 RepID=UPI001686073B|nr:hypothetical protein [Saccharopolyspora pogona]